MPKLFRVLFLSLFFASIILSLIYFPELKESIFHEEEKAAKEEAALSEANQLLLLDRPLEALAIVKMNPERLQIHTEKGKAWLELLTRGSEALPDTEQLKEIFLFSPEALKNHEKGALLVANRLIADGDTERYDTLRALFAGEEKKPTEWLLLDADNLVLKGDNESAAQLLKSRYFEGSEDTPRLLRLALLHLNHHPKTSWDYLVQAQKKDPYNLDVSLFKARLLEASGKGDLAEAEWDQAIKNKGFSQSVLTEELADFYIRRKKYDKALTLLQKNLNSGMKAPLLLNALFLSKTIQPLPFHFDAKEDKLENFASSLPEGKFWDEKGAPAELKSGEALGESYSALWLRTLENLRQNRDEDALTLLTHNMHASPYNPELKEGLISLLEVRLHDKKPDDSLIRMMKLPEGYPEEAESFLKSPDALYALFLAEGWNEAALSLYPKGGHAEQEPSWIAEAHAEALRKNRGLKEAIAYLSLQEETPALMALKGTYLLQNHQVAEGVATLNALAEKQGPEAEKAALLLAQIAYKNGAWSEAKKALAKNQAAEASTTGQTMLARIALEMKDEAEAQRIYERIEGDSFEAKSFLAKKAFEEGDMRKAYELTEKLLALDPENPVLRDNLEMLLQAQMNN